MDDEHPAIVDLKKRFGGTMADQITDDQLIVEFFHKDQRARAEELLTSDKWLADDDTTDMRKRAHLLSFRRKLREADYARRKVGR